MAIAPVIPVMPLSPVALIVIVAIRSVAIAIPDTGLLELPINPTIREDTVAKKKPNTTMSSAPRIFTGIAGTSQITRIIATIPIRTTPIGRSCAVLASLVFLLPFILLIESLKVVTISGRDLIKEIIPPVAIAPAPIYLT